MGITLETAAQYLDTVLPTSGDVGYLALIDNSTASVAVSSINTSTDVITTGTHGLVTGTRVRGSSTGSLPGAIAAATDYYVRSLSSTTLALYPTLADAQGDSNRLNFTDTGSGTLTLLEQTLSGGRIGDELYDPVEVWINHEIDHADYARPLVTALGSASTTTGEKPIFDHAISVNSPNGTLSFRHAVFLHDGTSTIGSTTNSGVWLFTLPSLVSISEGSTQTINVRFGSRPAVSL